jgi:hypothetical protein
MTNDELSEAVSRMFEEPPKGLSGCRHILSGACSVFESPLRWWHAIQGPGPCEGTINWYPVPELLTDIGVAWRVVEAMWERGWKWPTIRGDYFHQWFVVFDNNKSTVSGCGTCVAEAICRAALEAGKADKP